MSEYRTVSKEITWEAAHRLAHGYPGNCKHVHGHSYKATIVVALAADSGLDKFGFVKDFGDFKPLKDWVMANWDHASLVSDADKSWLKWLKQNKQRHYVLCPNTSAEILAKTLFGKASQLLNDRKFDWADDLRCVVREVRINETATSEAIYCEQ